MGMIEKLEKLLAARGWTQDAFERSAGLASSRISKWKGGQGEPTLLQGLRMARALGVSLDYLADEGMDEEPIPELDEDERHIVRIYRTLKRGGVPLEDVEDRLIGTGEGGGVKRPGPGPLQPLAERDESDLARRQEEKRRLGFELEADPEAAHGEDDPPLVRGRRR